MARKHGAHRSVLPKPKYQSCGFFLCLCKYDCLLLLVHLNQFKRKKRCTEEDLIVCFQGEITAELVYNIQMNISNTDHMPGGPGHMAGAAGEGGQGGPLKADKTPRM